MSSILTNLACNCNLVLVRVSHRTLFFVSVVKHDTDRSFGDTSLSIFVYKLLQWLCADLGQVCDSKNEANGVEDVRFSYTTNTQTKKSEMHICLLPLHKMWKRSCALPDPLRPVIALNSSSNLSTTVRLAYDLKPSKITRCNERYTNWVFWVHATQRHIHTTIVWHQKQRLPW